MFCQNCGSQVPDGTRFCPKCGAEVNSTAQKISNFANDAVNNAGSEMKNAFYDVQRAFNGQQMP